MIKNLFAGICTFIILLCMSQTIQACFCSNTDLEIVFSTSDAVFVGKVSKISVAKRASVGYVLRTIPGTQKLNADGKWEKSIDKVLSVTLEVIEPLKGVTEKKFVLFTGVYDGGGTCGILFKVGESYLVFADKTQPMLTKDEETQPKENWSLEMKLKAESDKFNEQLPLFSTGICSRTDRLRFMSDELVEIRNFLKNDKLIKRETTSPFMPPLPPY